MLWSVLKIALFLALAVALVFLKDYLLETPGDVRIAFDGREYVFSPLGFAIALVALFAAVIVLFKLAGLLLAILRFAIGDETAISRFFNRSRERRGYEALSDGIMALAAGDDRTAQAKAIKAERLLKRAPAARLIQAQAAERLGDRPGAGETWRALLGDERTRIVAIQGLMKQKLAEGDRDTARKLAQKAFEINPGNPQVLETLFTLQTEARDWAGARKTLNAQMHARLLPRDVGTRRDAVLSLADARAAAAAGDTERAQDAALQANKLSPTLIPAAVLAAEALAAQGSKAKAARVIRRAWDATPHPDLAAAFAALEPNETPAQRERRFETLTARQPDHPETRMLKAELALGVEDFPRARRALGDLAEVKPTARSLALMAAIERGNGAPDEVVRGFLARAVVAARGPQWVCSACNHIQGGWSPKCGHCEAFDTLDWREPPHDDDPGIAKSAMLPLTVVSPDRASGRRANGIGTDQGNSGADDAEAVDTPPHPTADEAGDPADRRTGA